MKHLKLKDLKALSDAQLADSLMLATRDFLVYPVEIPYEHVNEILFEAARRLRDTERLEAIHSMAELIRCRVKDWEEHGQGMIAFDCNRMTALSRELVRYDASHHQSPPL